MALKLDTQPARKRHFENPRSATGRDYSRRDRRGTLAFVIERSFAMGVGDDDLSDDVQITIRFGDGRNASTEEPESEERPEEADLADFLAMVYRLSGKGNSRLAIDLVIDQLDDALNAGDFGACEAILEQANERKLSDSLIVSFLGITSAAKERLPNRSGFFERAWWAVAARRGHDGAEKLLGKYR